MATAADVAVPLLAELADKRTNAKAAKAVTAGTHEWVWDPYVADVVGLVRTGSNRADIVVYVKDNDFEVSLDFDC
jgi:hypothetical protein